MGYFLHAKQLGMGQDLLPSLGVTSGADAPGVSIVIGVPQELDGNGKSPENMDENRGDPHDLGNLHIIISYNDNLKIGRVFIG